MSEKRNKQYTCKWEPNCDDDCRRPYGDCPDNCPNYKENKSVEELEKEIEEQKAIHESDKKSISLIIEKRKEFEKENAELKEIIIDVLKKHGELCFLCENKGQKLPECKCIKDEECLEHLIKLYKGGNK
ncbi:MAG: hypothetical protein MJ179_02420 [Treponema sp.]|nr:hypothetical protein [Treponema sp.]